MMNEHGALRLIRVPSNARHSGRIGTVREWTPARRNAWARRLRAAWAALALSAVLPLRAEGMASEAGPGRRMEQGAVAPPAGARPPGFTDATFEAERKAEAIFLAVPQPQKIRSALAALTEEPHVAGTPGGQRAAEWLRDRLKELGLDARLVPYDVLLNLPLRVSLRMTVPEIRELSLRETGYPRDKDSFSEGVLPAFHGYGASGQAKGQIVYANYGRPEDFDALEELGVSVRGRIVLARYGENFRGTKVSEAQKRGAAAVILYSDPADDGYAKGDVYPDGPWRPASAIQRGSVQFLSLGPGDPQTPGWPSRKDAVRVPREKLETIPKIPSLPISYGEAAPLLGALAGPNVPAGWQGALPFAYHAGPGPAEAEMTVEMDYSVRPIANVITMIPGAEEPDRWVVVGGHRDAWTYGAVDPNSSTAAQLEMARGLAETMKTGWRPKRTIVLASWDGEEYGLLGSTEWVEDLAAELGAKGVAYLNMDAAVSGPDLGMSGVASLRELALSVAGSLQDPRQGKTLLELWRQKKQTEWAEREFCPGEPGEEFYPQLDWLGSGSDYTAFLDFAGIPALDVRFSGSYGVYHSIFDDLYWMDRFGDPGYLTHALATRTAGLLVMRLADADALPFRFMPLARALDEHMALLRRLAGKKARFAAIAGKPVGPTGAPTPGLAAALSEFRSAATACDAALDELDATARPPVERLGALNTALLQVERAFLDPAGLPGRPWFRHLVYAPGLTTGYAAWPLPGLRQAVEGSDAIAFDREASRLAERLAEAARRLREAARLAVLPIG